MLSNDRAQAAIISYLKYHYSDLFLGNPDEIREEQWQGVEFIYPAVRVRIDQQSPNVRHDCFFSLEFAVLCFDENDSSKRCDILTSAVNNLLHRNQFTAEQINFFYIRSTGLLSSVRRDVRIWQGEARFLALIHPTS